VTINIVADAIGLDSHSDTVQPFDLDRWAFGQIINSRPCVPNLVKFSRFPISVNQSVKSLCQT